MSVQQGRELGPEELLKLTRARFSAVGCLWALVIYPIKKLVKYVLFFLTLKECLDRATDTILRGRMVRLALEVGALPGRGGEIKELMDSLFAEHPHSPVMRLLRRKERPPVAGEARDPLGRLADLLHREGGGGVLLPAFSERVRAPVEESPPTETPARGESEAGPPRDPEPS